MTRTTEDPIDSEVDVVITYLSAEERDRSVGTVRRRLEVRDHGTGLAATLRDLLEVLQEAPEPPPTWASHDPGGPDIVLGLEPSRDGSVGVCVDGGPTLGFPRSEVASEVVSRLCGFELATGGAPWLHGGAVTDGKRCILVVGESGAGKSTLIAHLCEHGWDLINDEQVALRPQAGVITSFTRPILLKPDAAPWAPPAAGPFPDGEPVLVRPARLGAHHRLSAVPTHVAFVGRREGPTVITPLDPPEAAFQLCLNSLDLAVRPTTALAGVGWLSSTVVAAVISYESSADGAGVVTEWARRSDRARPVGWELHPWHAPVPGAGLLPSPRTIGLGVGDEMLLFHRDTLAVVRLNPAASARWCGLPISRREASASDELWGPLIENGFAQVIDPARAARRSRLAAALTDEQRMVTR